jgi:hypothetical protein
MNRHLLYSSIIALSVILIFLASQFFTFQLFTPAQINTPANPNKAIVKLNQTNYETNLTVPGNRYALRIIENDNIDNFPQLIPYYLVVAYIIDASHQNKTIITLIIFKQKIYTIYLGAGDYILVINLEVNSPASINIPTSPSSQYIMLINLRYTALRFSLFTNMTLKISINVSRLPVISASFYGENISNKTIYASRLYAITDFGNFNSTMLSNLLAVLFYIDGIIVGISNNVNTNYGMVIYSQLVYQNFIKLDLSNVKKFEMLAIFQSTSITSP